MPQYYYVIDTSITNDAGVSVGQTTYDLLVGEQKNHGVIPIGAQFGLWHEEDGINHLPNYSAVGITTNRPVEVNNDLSVNRNLSVVGITTAKTYTVGGVQSVSQVSGTKSVDAATTQMLYLAGNYSTDSNTQTILFQVSNLGSGRSVDLYVKNAATCAYTITLQASTSTSGFAAVRFSNSGAIDLASFTLVAPGGGGAGAAHIWVANIDGQLVASLS
jgi:Tfp pilus assembly protein FimT